MLRQDLLFEGTVLSRKHDSWETKTKIIFWSWGCKWAIKGKWTLVEFNLRVLFFCCYWHRKGCLLNKGAYLVGASFNRNIWRGPHIREGALIGRRALNRIITVLHRFTENILGVMYFKLIFWFICTTLTCRTFLIHLYTLGVPCLRSASTIHDQ